GGGGWRRGKRREGSSWRAQRRPATCARAHDGIAAAGRPSEPGRGRQVRNGKEWFGRSSGGGFLVGIRGRRAELVEQGARVLQTACGQQVALAFRFLRWCRRRAVAARSVVGRLRSARARRGRGPPGVVHGA